MTLGALSPYAGISKGYGISLFGGLSPNPGITDIGGGVGVQASFATGSLTQNGSSYVFGITHATIATVVDWESIVRTVPINASRMAESRK